MADPERIWTVGHSTHSLPDFIAILEAHGIRAVADVRQYPMSRRLPHFNRDALAAGLAGAGLGYLSFQDLGGRRKARPDSVNLGWRNESFRGYADYMGTEAFRTALARLREEAAPGPTAVMCAEAVWWRCHRSLISDALKTAGVEVLHILGKQRAEPHPWTSPARIVAGRLTYPGPEREGDLFGT